MARLAATSSLWFALVVVLLSGCAGSGDEAQLSPTTSQEEVEINEHYSEEYSANADELPFVDEIASPPVLVSASGQHIPSFLAFGESRPPVPPDQLQWQGVTGNNVLQIPIPHRPTQLYMLFSSSLSSDGLPVADEQFPFQCGLGEQDECQMAVLAADGIFFTVPSNLIAEHGGYVIVQLEWLALTRDEVPAVTSQFASYALDLHHL